MLRHYQRDWKTRTKPYDGIEVALRTLIVGGMALGVFSNKPHHLVGLVVRHYFSKIPFGAVYGVGEPFPHKPDPTGALTIAEELSIAPSNLVFVGDSPVDIRTARAAGMMSIAVTWGFRDRRELSQAGAQHLVDHPEQIVKLVL